MSGAELTRAARWSSAGVLVALAGAVALVGALTPAALALAGAIGFGAYRAAPTPAAGGIVARWSSKRRELRESERRP